MNNWKYEKLSKLCYRIGDGLHGTPEYSERSDVYFINGNNLKNGKIEITENTKKVTSEELLKNFIQLDNNSLLLSINGTLGSMAFFKNEKVMLGKSAAYLNFKTEINKFYYYYFQLPSVQEHFHNVATGSTIKNLSLKSIQDFEVPVPDDNIWKNISKILSSLDAKIEINNRINTELEAMAKTLYDYWFVQFDFPDSNGKPYKTSGGKMVWNAELKRDIPKGWEVKPLCNVIEVKDGTHDSPKPKTTGYPLITSKNLKVEGLDFENANLISAEDYLSVNKRSKVETGDILFSMIGNIGTIYKVEEKEINFAIKNVALYKTSQKKDYKNFIYMFLKSIDMDRYMKNVISGSIQKFIGLSSLRNTPFLINETYIKKYEIQTKSIFSQLENLKLENQVLASLRDWLLPMLMNGQVSVGEFEEELGMVAEERESYK
jgi:type I restriction enzyme S subunit